MGELPTSFDVIVVGTGMPECIVAAALARVGKKVLHLDRNGYYGGDWASFSFDQLLQWMEETQSSVHPQEPIPDISSFLKEGESFTLCPIQSKTITNLTCISYIRDCVEVPPTKEILPSSATAECSVEDTKVEDEVQNTTQEPPPTGTTGESPPGCESPPSTSENLNQPIPAQQEWTISSFMENRRKFNIDLAPKIMFSRGPLVELLISSNIARYAEFQCITRVLTYIDGHIEQVPCSRADVFSTKNVTVVEKRMLMKFLTFCMKYEEQPEEYRGYEEKPFLDFLRSKKLTANVEHYVLHAIAMVDPTCPTVEGLKATQKFLQCLGRYGKSPFLCTCYGSAELPQCFCRLCAVYEGLYYLKRNVEAIIHSEQCCGIVSAGQRIDCEWLVMESSYAPIQFFDSSLHRISRAVLITSASLHPSDKREITLLRLPPLSAGGNVVTVLELSSKNYVCPEDLYLVYLYCHSSGASAEEDLKPAVEALFCTRDEGSTADVPMPSVLWSLYFNQMDTSDITTNSATPQRVCLTSSPDAGLDYDHAVKQAREIFEQICPDDEFLPRAPDPEDIIIDYHDNPGGEGEGGKIENDVHGSDPESDSKSDNVESADVDGSHPDPTDVIGAEGTAMHGNDPEMDSKSLIGLEESAAH